MARQSIQINTRANPAWAQADSGATVYNTFNDFPSAAGNDGLFAIDKATAILYCAFNGAWWAVMRLS